MTNTPLDGLKVIEMARVLAGPWAGQTLSDLGADVVKIESPKGDDTRRWGPPFVERDDDTSAAYFHSTNRGKKSVTIDFSNAKGQQEIIDLVKDADIFIENFKVGGLKKYNLDYDSLAAINPRLIYCSITGFGQTGPYAARAGYDFLMQGMGGIMSVTGDPSGQPQKVGVAVTDILTGLYAVIAIQAAVHQRERTGRGQHIDMALLDVATATMANQSMNFLTTGVAPRRAGNEHPNLVPYQVFDCADGHIIIATGNDGQYQRLCDVLGLDELAHHPDFASNADRVKNRVDLTKRLTAVTSTMTKSELLQSCEAHTVPAGPINSMAEVFEDPQVIARNMRLDVDGVPGVRSPFVFSNAELALDRPSPKLGEHNGEILKKR